MGLKKLILHMILWFCYQLAKCLPVRQNRITLIALVSQILTNSFKLLDEELKRYPDVEAHYILTKLEKTIKGDLLYFLNCIKQVFLINTSRAVILDGNNYIVSHSKRSQVGVLQVWHVCDAVKKFGNEIDRQYGIKNYDYVLLINDQWKPVYVKTFGVDEYQMLSLGVPQMDALFPKAYRPAYRNGLLEKYPVLQGKYVILCTPTSRGNIVKGLCYMDLDLSSLVEKLPDHYVVVYRMHPLLRDADSGSGERILDVTDEELSRLYTVADCPIAGYSSTSFDFSIIGEKVILYTPDLAEYEETLDFNIDLKSAPFPTCQTAENLAKEFCTKDYDKKSIKVFKDTRFMYRDGENTKRVSSFICQQLKQS